MNLQVPNMPDGLHWKAREIATSRKQTLREFVIQAVENEIARLTYSKEAEKEPEHRRFIEERLKEKSGV